MAGTERDISGAASLGGRLTTGKALPVVVSIVATFMMAGATGAQAPAPSMPGAAAPALSAPAPDATAAPPVATPTDLSAPVEPQSGALVAPAETDGATPAAPGASPAPATVVDGVAAELAPPAEVPALPRDLSPWGMYRQADVVVKGVMIGLAFASVVTWTVLFAKGLEFLLATLRLRRGYAVVSQAPDLETAGRALAGRSGPAGAMVRAAAQEARASAASLPRGGGVGFLQRVASHLGRIEHQAGRRLNAGTGVLATIGATAPFVGLFGTVWGIMNSFIGISESQTTNLAVVAPGIAEALLATAIGLVAAIPAVVVYNVFARWSAAYRARLADAAAAVERLVSRDLDHDRLGQTAFARAAE